jgi:DNA-binding GntR family transcriptional regulator
MAKSVKSRNAWEQAYESIRDLILHLEIQPGETVTETSLSQRLGTSRTPVREAVKRLEHEGLIVTTNRRKRAYVLTIQEIEEIFDLKVCLEGGVAAWAAERATDAQRVELAAVIEKMKQVAAARPSDAAREARWLQRWQQQDRRFHAVLFDMAGNGRARQIVRNCNMQWHRLRLGMLTMEGRIERSVGEHDAIAGAVVAGRPAAARKAMEQHLRNLRRELVKIMRLLHFPGV